MIPSLFQALIKCILKEDKIIKRIVNSSSFIMPTFNFHVSSAQLKYKKYISDIIFHILHLGKMNSLNIFVCFHNWKNKNVLVFSKLLSNIKISLPRNNHQAKNVTVQYIHPYLQTIKIFWVPDSANLLAAENLLDWCCITLSHLNPLRFYEFVKWHSNTVGVKRILHLLTPEHDGGHTHCMSFAGRQYS